MLYVYPQRIMIDHGTRLRLNLAAWARPRVATKVTDGQQTRRVDVCYATKVRRGEGEKEEKIEKETKRRVGIFSVARLANGFLRSVRREIFMEFFVERIVQSRSNK